jgi:hypothetical protein
MGSFLNKTTVFILTSMLLLTCIILIPDFLVKKFSKFNINKGYKIVLFGHSHSECAFNDSLISGFKNLSHSAEPYFYTYQKVKKVISQNNQVETILIEFSNNQIDEKMDEWTWGYKYMSNMFPQYASFMDPADLELLFNKNPKDFINCVSILARQNIFRAVTLNYSFSGSIGGYLKINNPKPLELNNKALSLTKDTVSKRTVLSITNLKYLRKTIDYCRQKNKNVFLVRSPQHRGYEYMKNEKVFMTIKKTYFQDVDFLDFNNFPLKDDEFADLGHLNFKGASKFSDYVNKLISSGVLEPGKKQVLINMAMPKKMYFKPVVNNSN